MTNQEFLIVVAFILAFFLLTVIVIIQWQMDLHRNAKEMVKLLQRQELKEAAWDKERGRLLDRIMAQDLTEFKTMEQVTSNGADIPQHLSDKDEAEIERKARGD
jgi:predicted Holliday junction resolvase-like endonuclease